MGSKFKGVSILPDIARGLTSASEKVQVGKDGKYGHIFPIFVRKQTELSDSLRRNLYSCPQTREKQLIKDWDPHTHGLQEELEKVQNHAARFVTGNYVFEIGSMTGILGQLKWESLKKRRKDSILILL